MLLVLSAVASAGVLFLNHGRGSGSQVAYATFPGVNGKIAFTSERDGNREIYSMNADGSSQTRLTNALSTDQEPDLSPDGTKIAYICNSNAICVMNSDGSGSTQIVSSGVNDNPSWSPDGTKIAFSIAGAIDIMNSDGSGATLLTNGQNPSWSPDGTKIAFTNNGNIATIKLDGTGLAQITTTGLDSWPSWSPDGTKIVFNRFVSGTVQNYQIYTINADGSSGGTATKLSIGSNLDRFPDFGPLPSSQQQQVTLTVNSKDTSGNPITGYWTVLYDGSNGSVQRTGFTPATFTLTAGLPYQIGMGNYGSYYFDHWEDNLSTTNSRSVSITGDTTLTAVYRIG